MIVRKRMRFLLILIFMGILLNQMCLCMVPSTQMKIQNHIKLNLFQRLLILFRKCLIINLVFLPLPRVKKIPLEFFFFFYRFFVFQGVFFKNFAIDNCYTIEASFGFFKNTKGEFNFFNSDQFFLFFCQKNNFFFKRY